MGESVRKRGRAYVCYIENVTLYIYKEVDWWESRRLYLPHWTSVPAISVPLVVNLFQSCCYPLTVHLENSMNKELNNKEIKHECSRSEGLHTYPDHFREPEEPLLYV